jgi:predicted RNA binding protein YcfA (HicA-like mRNA interferase family)
LPELSLISGDECMRALSRIGYAIVRSRGSHFRLICPGRPPVTVPRHRELDRRTLRSIIQQANLTAEEFVALL